MIDNGEVVMAQQPGHGTGRLSFAIATPHVTRTRFLAVVAAWILSCVASPYMPSLSAREPNQPLPHVSYGGVFLRKHDRPLRDSLPYLSRLAGINEDGSVDREKSDAFKSRFLAFFQEEAPAIRNFRLVFGGMVQSGDGDWVFADGEPDQQKVLALFFDAEDVRVETITIDGRVTYKMQYILAANITIFDFSRTRLQGGEGIYVIGNFPIFFSASNAMASAGDMDSAAGLSFVEGAIFHMVGYPFAGKELIENLQDNAGPTRCDLLHHIRESMLPSLYFMQAGATDHVQVRAVNVNRQPQRRDFLGSVYTAAPDHYRLFLAQRLSAEIFKRLGVSVLPPDLVRGADGNAVSGIAQANVPSLSGGGEAILLAGKAHVPGLGEAHYPGAAYQIHYTLRGLLKVPDGNRSIYGAYSRLNVSAGDREIWGEEYKFALPYTIPPGVRIEQDESHLYSLLVQAAVDEGVRLMDPKHEAIADMLFNCRTRLMQSVNGQTTGERK